jgi:hypothetical protein
VPRAPVPASALPEFDNQHGLFVSDTELVGLLGCSEKRGRAAIRELERQGFPQPDPLFGGRYWPAVRAFLDRRYGLGAKLSSPLAPDGAEKWDDET